jgi:hypothetical protein
MKNAVVKNRRVGWILLLLLAPAQIFAQSGEFDLLQKKVKSALWNLDANWWYWTQDTVVDGDLYCNKLARNIGKLLTFKESYDSLDLSGLTHCRYCPAKTLLRLAAKTDDIRHIRIYEFCQPMNGTAAFYYHPVMQWTDDDGNLRTYYPVEYFNYSSVEQIYPLGDDLYLVICRAKRRGSVQIVRFGNNHLRLDYPAFAGASTIDLTDFHFLFDRQTQVLTGQAEGGYGDISGNILHIRYLEPSIRSILSVDFGREQFRLKFDKGKFTAPDTIASGRYIHHSGVRFDTLRWLQVAQPETNINSICEKKDVYKLYTGRGTYHIYYPFVSGGYPVEGCHCFSGAVMNIVNIPPDISNNYPADAFMIEFTDRLPTEYFYSYNSYRLCYIVAFNDDDGKYYVKDVWETIHYDDKFREKRSPSDTVLTLLATPLNRPLDALPQTKRTSPPYLQNKPTRKKYILRKNKEAANTLSDRFFLTSKP